MKRMGSITIFLAVLAMPAQAQRPGPMRGSRGPEGVGDRERAGELQADAILRLRDRLNLSDEQVEGVRAAQETDRAARDAMRLETRGLRDQLRDEEITREEFREEMSVRRSSVEAGRTTQRESLGSILTGEQRSQMQNLRRQENRGRNVRGARARGRSAQGRGQVSRGSQPGRGGPNMRRPDGARARGPQGAQGRRTRGNVGTSRGGRGFGRR